MSRVSHDFTSEDIDDAGAEVGYYGDGCQSQRG
jgi:hypothetical protein